MKNRMLVKFSNSSSFLAVIFLMFCSFIVISAQTSKSTLEKSTTKITKERLVKFARALAECPETGMCNNSIPASKLIDSLQNSPNYRPSGRTGLPNFNYDDFAVLVPKFGYAFAKLGDSINPTFGAREPLKTWDLNEDKPWAELTEIVCEPYEDAPPEDIEVPLTEYVPELFLIMGGTKTQVSQEKFVDFMWRKQ